MKLPFLGAMRCSHKSHAAKCLQNDILPSKFSVAKILHSCTSNTTIYVKNGRSWPVFFMVLKVSADNGQHPVQKACFKVCVICLYRMTCFTHIILLVKLDFQNWKNNVEDVLLS